MMPKMKRTRRNRDEWDGAWKWDTIAIIHMMRTKKAATGWTTRMADSVVRVCVERVKVADEAASL